MEGTEVFIAAEKTDQTFLDRVCPRKCSGLKPKKNKHISIISVSSGGRSGLKIHPFY